MPKPNVSSDVPPPPIAVELLGPLRLVVHGVPVDVPGPKRQAVLALLALAEGHTVSTGELVDALWPSEPPAAARAALHSHVSRLRGHLGPAAARLETVGGGYRLRLEPSELDVRRVRDQLADIRQRAAAEPAAVYPSLLDLRRTWRGAVLADLGDVLPIAARSVALDELRREVDALLVECGLAAGDGVGLVGVAAAAVAEEPLREPSVMLLMRALAESGRPADALRAAYEFRQRLKEGAGLDPSPAFGELERSLAAAAARSVARRAGAVPVPLSPLVGRESEVAAVRRLLATERLVTVVGPGGVGKTRVAIDVARRHDDATFLALAPVTDPSAIPHALATALDLDAVAGDALAACIAFVSAGPRLLVVDNCEHVLDDVRGLVRTLLETCPGLTVLATSRERLGLPLERQVRLGPLALPDTLAPHPERAPAVAVFVERARRARPGFAPDAAAVAVIADIVRRLDGLPLAIELAAGRLSSLGLPDLHARLDRALDLLEAPTGPEPDRHQTLRATIEWSYALLGEPEQRLLCHLAVFPDGVDLATAEMVAADVGVAGDLAVALGRLVDTSMVDADLDGTPRYRMLETVRSYGLDRLEVTGEAREAGDRLIRWAVDLAHWIDAALQTADEGRADAQLRRELPNLRAAWRLAQDRSSVAHAIELVVALDDVAQWRDLPELWHWAENLAADPRVPEHPRAAAALATASDAAWLLGHLDVAERLAEQALASASDDDGRWRALLATAVVDLSRADFPASIAHALEAAAISPRPAHAYWVAALAAAYAGDVERATTIVQRGEATSPTLRAERAYVAAEIASITGALDTAERHYQQAIDLSRAAGATFMAGIATVGLLTVQARAGRIADALRGYAEVLEYWEGAGNWIQVWTTLRNLADLLRTVGDERHAVYLEVAADHAPGSAAVGDAAWRRDTGRPSARIPAHAVVTITAEAASAAPAQVLAVARQAIDDGLRTAG